MSNLTTDTVAVGERDGRVVLEFEQPVRWVQLDSQTAAMVAEEIARRSYAQRYGVQPDRGKALATELRNRMVARTMHVIRSTQEGRRSPDYVARAVVDTILAEVL